MPNFIIYWYCPRFKKTLTLQQNLINRFYQSKKPINKWKNRNYIGGEQ